MAHWSEASRGLEIISIEVDDLSQLHGFDRKEAKEAAVYLFRLPFPRSNTDAINSRESFLKLTEFCSQLNEESVVCFLTSPPDAAVLLPYLEKFLKFQLWVAVKTNQTAYSQRDGNLPNRHAALLVLTKYKNPLRHTKTRIKYTYCPVCGKTTKDYGGKKHTYHEYGTLLSDVWRDVECGPGGDINAIINRLSDIFGLDPYRRLRFIDAAVSKELLPSKPLGEAEATRYAAFEQQSCLPQSRLINEDCLKALSAIPDDSIDFCFADPPYNLKKKYDKWDDALESVEYFAWCDKWLSELCRVLKPGRTLAVLNIPLWAVRHYQHLNSIMNFQSWIAWDGLSFPVRMIMPAHYAIICFSKGASKSLPGLSPDCDDSDAKHLMQLDENYCLRSDCCSLRRRLGKSDRSPISDLWHDIHRLKHNSRRVDHPCQLPPALMRRLFSLFTKPGETILDCFNGAGTSTLVAQEMKRGFIGVELSQQYHEIALRRHMEMEQGIDPFGKVKTIPTAKNSPVQRLPKRKYQVSKKNLQLDVRRIASELGRLPTREEVSQLSKYPIKYFDSYFVSWGEVCAAARTTGMSEKPSNASDASLEKQLGLYAQQDKQ